MVAKKKPKRAAGWCTLYALTRGVYRVTGEFRPSAYGGAPWVWVDMGDLGTFHPTLTEGFTFFRTRKEAVLNARQQASDLIGQLRSRILKAEALRASPKFVSKMPKTARLL